LKQINMMPTCEKPETDRLHAHLEELLASPPENVTIALRDRGVTAEDLQEYARGALSPEALEMLRRVVLHAAQSGTPEDAKLAARMRVYLDPRERSWERILRAHESGELITAMVTEAVKGGLVVDLGVRGFVPASHVGLGGPPNLSSYVGQSLPLRVIEVDRRRQKVVLSHRVVAEQERQSQRRETIATLAEGEVREGIVRRMTEIGAFVDLGGVDGLLHVSELAWKRIEHPSEVLKVGQKIQVKILKVDPSQGRISLSLRRLQPDPWAEASKQFAVGKTVPATVRRIVSGGVVVDLGGEIEGFIPMSELAARRVGKAEEVVQVGKQIEAAIIEVRPRDRRIVLSLRQGEEIHDRKVYESYAQRSKTSDRTTIGDLFGHLFRDFQAAEEETPDAETARAEVATAPEEFKTAEEPQTTEEWTAEEEPTATAELTAAEEPTAAEEHTAVPGEPA
jgi:transcriptional accessory protein Tex/SPT6